MDNRKKSILGVADMISVFASRLAEVGVVAMTVLLTYEVLARYVFRAPTYWTSDVSTTIMIWMTYLAMGYCLRGGHMIRITAVIGVLNPVGRKIAAGFSLLVILAFSVFAVWLTSKAMMESIAFGRRAPSMLRMPMWISELPVVVGFVILSLQALADFLRLPFRPAPEFASAAEQEMMTDDNEGRS